jgi:monofunctional biosynthetic peptidoglycan transglycosylase
MERDVARGIPVRWEWAPAERISVHLFRAVLVAEDIEFFSHEGFSTVEIRTAVEQAVAGERLRGASTITQQLAKNLWLDPSRTTGRKLREALLTWQLERTLSKPRILELYVNVVQFGPGIYGAEAASRHYFGTPAAALTEKEAAQLAAGLSRPSSWNPGSSSSAYAGRVELLRQRMDRAQFLWRHVKGTVPVPLLSLDSLVPDSLPGPYPLVPPPDSLAIDSVVDTMPGRP